MVERKFYLFLLAGVLYAAHNFTNFLLYGYDLFLVITFVPFLIVGTVWGFWKKLHPYIIAPILVLLALAEIPVVGSNFHGFQWQSISGVFQVGAMLVLCIHAVLLVKGKMQSNQKLIVEGKKNEKFSL